MIDTENIIFVMHFPSFYYDIVIYLGFVPTKKEKDRKCLVGKTKCEKTRYLRPPKARIHMRKEFKRHQVRPPFRRA
jgi:hypothetical protein